MAVTLDVAALVSALRMSDTAEETAEATRLLAYATEAVTRHAPDAPAVVANEAAIRLCGYLYDQPNAGRGVVYADAMRNSGARAILLPHRVHRAGAVVEAVSEAAAGSRLRQIGVEVVTVTTTSRWVSTSLDFPPGDIFGASVESPDGTTPITLGRTQELVTPGAVVGGDAAAALAGLREYAVAAVTTGGAVLFASTATGAHVVRLFAWS